MLDFGRASALRSQTLWHAVAYGVSAGSPPTLSFVRPAEPYVSIGYHRRLEEIDLAGCRSAGLPVYRRMIGGGPVYLDDGQLFFQIVVPARLAPLRRDAALRKLLAPAVAAFRAVGVPASLDSSLEIVAGDRKICGHGAGQVGDAVVVVGNLIERFDHEAAARVVSVADPGMRAEALRLMRRYVAATPADAAAFASAAARAYGDALGLAPSPGRPSRYERARLEELDRRFESEEWLRGPDRPPRAAEQLKIRAGVWLAAAEHAGARVTVAVVDGRIERALLADPELDGARARAEAALAGAALRDAAALLRGFGPPGERLGAALAKVDERGLRG